MISYASMARASCLGAGVEDFAKELVVLMRLRHEHIVTFYGIYQHFHVEGSGIVSDRCARPLIPGLLAVPGYHLMLLLRIAVSFVTAERSR